jgi:hypothetical protein
MLKLFSAEFITRGQFLAHPFVGLEDIEKGKKCSKARKRK